MGLNNAQMDQALGDIAATGATVVRTWYDQVLGAPYLGHS